MVQRADHLPSPPEEPDLDACCGSGCDPCIFDIYEERLERWRRRCEALEASAQERRQASVSAD